MFLFSDIPATASPLTTGFCSKDTQDDRAKQEHHNVLVVQEAGFKHGMYFLMTFSIINAFLTIQ